LLICDIEVNFDFIITSHSDCFYEPGHYHPLGRHTAVLIEVSPGH